MRFFNWILLIFLFSSCSVPSAAPEEEPTLVIATDRTYSSDSVLFRSFEKKHKVKVEIRKMSADSLIQIFQKNRYNSGVDVIIMHQLYDMRKLTEQNIFETVELDELPENSICNPQRTVFGVGIDPFVSFTKSDFNWDINIYDDLSKTKFINVLSKKSLAQFFAPFEQRMTRAKTYSRIERIMKNSIAQNSPGADSVNVILCSYSQYLNRASEDSLWKNYKNIHYPNSKTSGVFFDLLSAGVVDQSSHYDLSIKFLNWIIKKRVNNEFNSSHGYLPMSNHPQFSIYARSPTKLMQYHTMIERMLKDID